MSTSIWSRKMDLFHVVFLAVSVFLALAVDMVHYFPPSTPKGITALYDYMIENYNDPLYLKNPTYFKVYAVIEIFVSVPAAIWCTRGLVRDDRSVHVLFLVLATHIVSSTVVCLGELWAMQDWPQEDINKNLPGYVGYLAIAIFVWLDIFSRVKNSTNAKTKLT